MVVCLSHLLVVELAACYGFTCPTITTEHPTFNRPMQPDTVAQFSEDLFPNFLVLKVISGSSNERLVLW